MAKKQFKAESKRLLDMMINSIYTHKEIFLREIISNSSDALDKLCYKALTEDGVGVSREDLYIKVTIDKENRIVKVSAELTCVASPDASGRPSNLFFSAVVKSLVESCLPLTLSTLFPSRVSIAVLV